MTGRNRATARELSQRYIANGDPMGWFEVLYATAESDLSIIPWADLAPNPNLVSWLEQQDMDGAGHNALEIGCGLGDDAEELSRRGFDTTAFDISPTAISLCCRRFPKSTVRYIVADLFKTPGQWVNRFDFVLESYTLQVLPSNLRKRAIRHMASFVAPSGIIVVIARGREPGEPEGQMPWPITRQEMATFKDVGLTELNFDDYMDNEMPPVYRFRATYQRK